MRSIMKVTYNKARLLNPAGKGTSSVSLPTLALGLRSGAPTSTNRGAPAGEHGTPKGEAPHGDIFSSSNLRHVNVYGMRFLNRWQSLYLDSTFRSFGITHEKEPEIHVELGAPQRSRWHLTGPLHRQRIGPALTAPAPHVSTTCIDLGWLVRSPQTTAPDGRGLSALLWVDCLMLTQSGLSHRNSSTPATRRIGGDKAEQYT